MPSTVKTVGKYDLFRTLGEGAYGKVKYAVNKELNEPVAIKILDKEKIQKQNMGAQIKKEIMIMRMITHKNVIAVKDVFATSSKIFIVVELVEGGELFEHLVDRTVLPEDEARFFFHQLVDGLMYCHSAGICHRDLKPENLLLDSNGNLKISDFGLSTLYVGDADAEGNQRAELLHTTCGTPNYVAPEVLESRGYDGKKADVWSVGVILFVLLAGYLPFEEKTMPALFSKIKRADFAYPMWFSPNARALLSGILVPNPAARFALVDVSNHAWLQGTRSPPSIRIKKKIGPAEEETGTASDGAQALPKPPASLATAAPAATDSPSKAAAASAKSGSPAPPLPPGPSTSTSTSANSPASPSPAGDAASQAAPQSQKPAGCLPFLCGSAATSDVV